MLSKLVLAIIIAIAVTLGCLLLGTIFASLGMAIVTTIGNFLRDYAALVGVLAGLWYFFTWSL